MWIYLVYIFRLQNNGSTKSIRLVNNNGEYVGLNQQTLDLGLMERDFSDRKRLEKQIKRLQREFNFVMIEELFYESLVLLAHHLCLPLNYMAGIKYSPLKVTNLANIISCMFIYNRGCCLKY